MKFSYIQLNSELNLTKLYVNSMFLGMPQVFTEENSKFFSARHASSFYWRKQ